MIQISKARFKKYPVNLHMVKVKKKSSKALLKYCYGLTELEGRGLGKKEVCLEERKDRP